MKRFSIGVLCLLTLGGISANEEASSHYTLLAEEETLALESEIDALIEDDMLAESERYTMHSNELFEGSQQGGGPHPLPVYAEAKELKVVNPSPEIDEQACQIASFPAQIDQMLAETEAMVINPQAAIDTIEEETARSVQNIEINLKQVFAGSPIIYTLLLLLSTTSVCIWLYSMLSIRSIDFLSPKLAEQLRTKLVNDQFDEALDLCVKQKHFFCKMLASGILARRHGLNAMADTMKAEGRRSTVAFWQRLSILNEIAIIAPMLGLLGTVLGMFYAFYDLNRSVESVSLLFDGLGISVGTTVAGLIVAILAMILYSLAKYRLVRTLTTVENQAQSFAALIDARSESLS